LVLEEVRFLAGTDHPDRLAARLGYRNGISLVTQLQHWGRYDLAERVTRGYHGETGRSAA
jgi:hypothetical protein